MGLCLTSTDEGSGSDVSPPASPYKYTAPASASVDLTATPSLPKTTLNFRAALSSPLGTRPPNLVDLLAKQAQKRQLLTSKKGTEGGAIILNKLNVDQSKNTQVTLADKEHGQLLRGCQTLRLAYILRRIGSSNSANGGGFCISQKTTTPFGCPARKYCCWATVYYLVCPRQTRPQLT